MLVWKSSTNIAFAVNGAWAVAWICDAKGNDFVTLNAVKDNVFRRCMKDGVNTCVNNE